MPSAQANAALQLHLAQLPGRIRRALAHFHRLTGLTAVVTVATSLPVDGEPLALLPPVHPRCARRLRSVSAAPCRSQWALHLRSVRRSPPIRRHECPLGLRCAGVPVHLGDRPVGLAKVVLDSGTSDEKLTSAMKVLHLVLDGTSWGSVFQLLSEELGTLRRRVSDLKRLCMRGHAGGDGSVSLGRAQAAPDAAVRKAAVVQRALDYLQRNYRDPALCLPDVAEALDCNPRYLTARFTEVAGERMHGYLTMLRVAHARRLLIATDRPIKSVAFESGFRGHTQMERTFHRFVGVSPREYRRLFAAS